VAESGPACDTCHTWPFTPGSVSCNACHRLPPNGFAFPNIAGKHAKHSTSVLTTCDICHSGASGYTNAHRNGVVNVAILNNPGAYRPLSGGTPTFNAATGTCSNVSCHGAQQTPSWITGAINVNTQCTACHAEGATQYNSYYSGEHGKHMGINGVVCTDCHDTTKLAAVHFNDLNTSAMNQAYLTIQNALGYTGTAGSMGNCTVECHGEGHSNRSWIL
jgi:predicted CxxxxCH...CXXCH cytochrome family protein